MKKMLNELVRYGKFAFALAFALCCFSASADATPGAVQLWAGGPYWATCNVGATSESDRGLFFSWGGTVGYSSSTTSFNGGCPTLNKTVATLQSEGIVGTDGVLAAAYDAANVNLGGTWRLPTKDELDMLTNTTKCQTKAETIGGMKCIRVSGVGDYADKSIVLPCVGFIQNGGGYGGDQSCGYYPSAIPFNNTTQVYGMMIQGTALFNGGSQINRANGYAIRAVCSTNPSVITPAEHFAKKVDFTIGGYSGTSTLENFPVLVKLSTSINDFNYSDCAQDSIRFLDADGNLIPHEVDTWNPSGESFIWVSVPSLSGTSTKITMCYGGNGSSCSYAIGNVWTLANYKSVWHLNIGSDNTTSSSVGSLTGTIKDPNTDCGAGTGLIGGDYYCEANDKYHCVQIPASSSFTPTTASTLTYTAWVRQIGGNMVNGKPDGTTYPKISWGQYGNCGAIWHTGNNTGGTGTGMELTLEGKQGDACFGFRDSSYNENNLSLKDIHDKMWHFVVVRYNAGSVTIWIDGEIKETHTSTYTDPSASVAYLGARKTNGDSDCVWTGDLDEIRFRDAASSDDWLAAEYANVTLASFMSNSGATNIGDEPLAREWTVREMGMTGAEIRTDGTFKYGYCRHTATGSTSSRTVNGVTFVAYPDESDFNNNQDAVFSPGMAHWYDAFGAAGVEGAWGDTLNNGFYNASGYENTTLTLNGLTAGKQYVVQIITHNNFEDDTITVGGVTAHAQKEYGSSLECEFAATAASESFALTCAGGKLVVNAIQVRELSATPPVAPWDTAHGTFAKRIAFTASGYEGSETLENFPVLVRLSTAISGFNYTDCGTNGADIQFADDNGHVLPYEIDTWNASGESLIWVNVASLSRGARFYMYFDGTPSAANISTSTWNSNYVGVWHMSEVKGSVADATGHGLTAVPAGSNGQYNDQVATTCCRYTGTDAPVGYARTTSTTQAVGGNDGRLVIADDNQLDIGGTFTFSTWVRKTTDENYTRIVSKKLAYTSPTGWEVEVSGNKFNARGVSSGTPANECTGDFPTMKNNWVHVVVVYDNTTITVYGNGEEIQKKTGAGAATNSDRPLVIGANASDSFGNRINGAFDECRLLDAVASADWVKAEYQQSAKPTFLSAGAVETHVASTYTVSWTGGVNATVVATVDSTPIDTGDSVEDGKTVCFTVTPDNGYEFASAPTGWELSSGNLTKNVTVSGAAITETIPSATAIIYPFYIGSTGYDSWWDAYDHANGATIKVGVNAEMNNVNGHTLSGTINVDLDGQALLISGGYMPEGGNLTIIDNVGSGTISLPNSLNVSGVLDFSQLDGDHLTIANYGIKVGNANSLVKFPSDWTIDYCKGLVNSPVIGARIIAQNVTYTWDGSAWVAVMTGDYYVSPNGDDSNLGTSRNAPFKTIQKALEEADKEDGGKTIVALRGTYEIAPTLNVGFTLKSGNTLIAEEGREVTFIVPKPGSSSWERCIKIEGTGAEKLIGFTITGFSGSVRGTAIHMTGGTVSWCCISNNATAFTGTSAYYGSAVSILSGTIDHTIVANNTGNLPGAGIGATRTDGDILLDTCLIYGNGMSGNKDGTGGVKIQFTQTCACVIRNCTIVGNTSHNDFPAGLHVAGDDGKVVLVNDIISGNLRGESATDELNVRIDSANRFNVDDSMNCIISGTKDTTAGKLRDAGIVAQMSAAGFIGTAPTFVGAGDYHLAAGSAGIAAGASYDGIGVDLDNKAFAATPSIGCYEYDGVAPTTYAVTWSGAVNATVSATVDGAAIMSGAMVANGKSVVFTVTPNTGYEFATASDGWMISVANLTKTVTVNGAAVSVTVPDATQLQVSNPVIGSVTATPSANRVTISLAGIALGTDANGNPATQCELTYMLSGAASASGTGRTMSAFSGTTSSFTISNLENGEYTCTVTLTTDNGKTAEGSATFTIAVSEDPDEPDEPTLEEGWTAEPMSGSGDIRTDGALIYAYMRGNAKTTYTINTVTFSGLEDTSPFASDCVEYGNITRDATLKSPSTDPYEMMMGLNWRGSAGNNDLKLKGLVAGNYYLVQLVVKSTDSVGGNAYGNDEDGASTTSPDGEATIWSSGSGWENGGSLVGIFKATGDTETFKLNSTTRTILNAIQVRDVSPVETVGPQATAALTRQAIQDAIDRAAPVHRQVKLSEGTFLIDKELFVTNGVTLTGQGWKNTIIKQTATTGKERVVSINGGAKVEGVTLTGGDTRWGADWGARSGAGAAIYDGTISWCCISNNISSANNGYGSGVGFPTGRGSIDHTIIAENKSDTNQQTHRGSAIGFFNTTGAITVDTCLIFGNTGNGSGMNSAAISGTYNAQCTGERLLAVLNTTITDNPKGAIYLDAGDAGSLLLVNDIISGNGSKNVAINSTSVLSANSANCIFGTADSSTLGSSVQNSAFYDNLGFVDAENGNYHLGDLSIACGAGTAYDGIGVDLDNKPFETNPSVGCYEYAGTGFVPTGDVRKSIQDAIDAAAPVHGTVHLGEGTFEIDQQLFVTNGVTLAGQGWEKTVIKQTGVASAYGNQYRCVTLNGQSTISGLTLTGGQVNDNGGAGAGVNVTEDGGTISWCRVTGNKSVGFNGAGIGINCNKEVTVKIDHTIVDSNTNNTTAANGGGIGIFSGNRLLTVEIDTCLIYGNFAKGNGGGIGIATKATTNTAKIFVRNTTIADNHADNVGGGIFSHQQTPYTGYNLNELTLVNDIISDNTAGVTAAIGDANIAYAGDSAADLAAFVEKNALYCLVGTAAEIGFVDAANGDYRLTANSPALAAGVRYEGMGEDLAHVAFAATPAVGCYEYASRVPAPVFNPDSCKFDTKPLRVELSRASTDYTIRYTTDGSTPTETSAVFNNAIMINDDVATIKARCYDQSGNASSVAAAKYRYKAPGASDWYVATDGNDFNDGMSPEHPFKTIEHALEVAVDGEEIFVAAGPYEISETLVVDKAVTVKGAGMNETVIKPATGKNIQVVTLDGGAKLEHVEVTGGNSSTGCGGVQIKNGTLSWSRVEGNRTSAAYMNGGVSFCNGMGQIDHCIVANNVSGHSCYGPGIGARCDTNTGMEIVGPILVDTCLVYGNSGAHSISGGGIGFKGAAYGLTIRNCTVVGNTSALNGGLCVENGSGKIVVVNNIVYNNTTGGTPQIKFSSTDQSGVSNNLETDPGFVGTGNYHPAGGSPALGAGVWYEGIGETLDGVPFLDPPAIGCYEAEGGFGTVTFEETAKHKTEATTHLIGLRGDATSADVYFVYGSDAAHTCAPILVKADAAVDEDLTVEMVGLNALDSYYYCFTATDNLGVEYTRSGTYKTPDWDVLSFSTAKVEERSRSADVSVTIMKLGLEATKAEVWLAWGENGGELSNSVRLSTTAEEKQQLSYVIDGLENETTYQFVFTGTNDVGDVATRAGTFTTLAKEHLTLGEPKVSELTDSSAKVGIKVNTVGEDAMTANLTLQWGIGEDQSNSATMSDVSRGETKTFELTGLMSNQKYKYTLTATNDADPAETVTVTGYFWTDDTGAGEPQPSYPTPGTGEVVTYDADNAGDPSTLNPGSPYRVVSSTGYGYEVTGCGKKYYFRDVDDFKYNASARIGDTYYLFLSDAVDAAQNGETTIELLRNNYAIEKTMKILSNKTIRIIGNGYTVKVAYPFLDTTGYVNPNCTQTPRQVFTFEATGALKLENMMIMGGGVPSSASTSNTSGESAISMVSGGTLEMDHVTIARSQGGLWVPKNGKVYMNACNLVKNARMCGGGFYSQGIIVMVNSSLSENRSLNSGGGGGAAENQGLLVMNNCVICNNGSTEYGGAINNLNNTGNSGIVYMMNMTMAGNFSSNTNDDGGGLGLHAGSGDLYMLNCILCNNYHYVTTASKERADNSDVKHDAGNNYFYYSVYGTFDGGASYLKALDNCWQVNPTSQNVFKGYTSFARVYEESKTTAVSMDGPTLPPAGSEYARYAPLSDDNSAADVGDQGVYTYFNATNWRNAEDNKDITWLAMGYKSKYDSVITKLGKCGGTPTEADLVTTYYESAFDPNITDRELGVVGASGFGNMKKQYTLYLLAKPVNGSVSDNLTLNGAAYDQGASVTVVATPAAKCSFIRWENENGEEVSTKSSYTFTMDSDKHLKAIFSEPSDTYRFLNIVCEQIEGHHDKFPLEVTKAWLQDVYKKVPTEESEYQEIEEDLNLPDPVNGLNHKWMNYVLGGMKPGDPDGRIWIRGEQTADPDTLNFKVHELAETVDCGFLVRYRLAKMNVAKQETGYVRNHNYQQQTKGTFDTESVASDELAYRVIDMIFIPTNATTSASANGRGPMSTSYEYVTTVNTAGVLRVRSDKKVEILSSPWVGFSPDADAHLPVKAPDYAKASCLSDGDKLYVYDRANSNYLAWVASKDGSWTVSDTYLIKDGVVQYQHEADASRTNSLDRGLGAWLERKNPKSPIYLFGQVDPTPVETTLEPGFNLVGNPYPFEYDASQLPPGVDDKGVHHTGMYGDHIVVPTGADPINAIYDPTKEAWMWPSNAVVPMVNPKTGNPMLNPDGTPRMSVKDIWTTEGLTLPIGHGFWYNNTSGRSMDLNWASED